MDTKHLLLTIYFLCDFAKQKDKQKTFLTQPSASCRRQQWSRTQRRTPASSSGNSWCRSFWWFWTKPHSQASSVRKWTSRRRADLQQTSIKPTVFIKTLDQVSLDPIARPDIVLDWSCPSCCVSLSLSSQKNKSWFIYECSIWTGPSQAWRPGLRPTCCTQTLPDQDKTQTHPAFVQVCPSVWTQTQSVSMLRQWVL